jgi:hypothetical protein
MQARLRAAGENHVVRQQFNANENLPAIGILDLDRCVHQHSQCRHERIAARFSAKEVSLPNLQS